MWKIASKIVVFALLNLLVLTKGEIKEEGKHFNGYYPSEDDRNQVFPYPPANYPIRDDYAECAKNPLIPLMGKGLNLVLLKLGVFGLLKAVTAIALLAFLVKIPLLLLKATVVKSLFLPFLAAPLLAHFFMNQMSQAGEGANEKPMESKPEMPGIMGMNEMPGEMGRQLTQMGWRSLRMFVESEQCAERISCVIGASYKDSSMGSIFSRILKYLHHSSPPLLQERLTLIRKAFDKGSRTSKCMTEDYKCQSPALLIQHGAKSIRIL